MRKGRLLYWLGALALIAGWMSRYRGGSSTWSDGH